MMVPLLMACAKLYLTAVVVGGLSAPSARLQTVPPSSAPQPNADASRRSVRVAYLTTGNGDGRRVGFVWRAPDDEPITCATIAAHATYFPSDWHLAFTLREMDAGQVVEVVARNVTDAPPRVFSERALGLSPTVLRVMGTACISPFRPSTPGFGKGALFVGIRGFPPGSGLLMQNYNSDFPGGNALSGSYFCRDPRSLEEMLEGADGGRVAFIGRPNDEDVSDPFRTVLLSELPPHIHPRVVR